MRSRYHVVFTYLWSGFAFGLAVFQPKHWETVAVLACVIAFWHLYSVGRP